MGRKKGMEKGFEIIIALVIILIIAVSIIVIFNKNFRQADQSNEGTLNESASGISYNLCKIKCDACLAQGDGFCTNWDTFQARTGEKNKCDSEGIYQCPPPGSSETPSAVEESTETPAGP